MKKNILFSSLAILGMAAIAGTALPGCSEEKVYGSDNTYLDIVTIEDSNEKGTSFTLQEGGDTPLITLTASEILDGDKFKKGSRVLLGYKPLSQERFKSGPVELTGVANIEGSGRPVKPSTAEETSNWATQSVMIHGLWRTGKYLNMAVQMSYQYAPKEFEVYVDRGTIGTEFPSLYLVCESDVPVTTNNFVLNASYDISEIWDAPSTRGIRFHCADIAGNSLIEIKKETEQTKP